MLRLSEYKVSQKTLGKRQSVQEDTLKPTTALKNCMKRPLKSLENETILLEQTDEELLTRYIEKRTV